MDFNAALSQRAVLDTKALEWSVRSGGVTARAEDRPY